jgi:hypothetical protein
MNNRILDVSIHDRSLDPGNVELWITVTPDQLTATTEVRGRLMGPRCPYANTVEVAYPLRPIPGLKSDRPGSLRRRVVIPEASLWDTESPFLYEGPIELWEGDQHVETHWVRHGLRHATLGPRGLRINGRLFSIRGRMCEMLTEAESVALRQEGVDTLLAPLTPAALPLWDLADRFGFLVLGRVLTDETLVQRLRELGRRPSCLGFVVDDTGLSTDGLVLLSSIVADHGRLLGLTRRDWMTRPIPREAQFVLVHEGDEVPPDSTLPCLVLGNTPPAIDGVVIGSITPS